MKIVHYPHPALRHKAKPLTQIDKDLRLAVGRMFELMYEAVGVGLAATQVAIPHQILVMNMSGDPNEKDQEKVYINPVIVERKGVQEGDEGCLSFPGLFQKVRRAKSVKVQAYDMQGQLVELSACDLAARAWQHELDHLDGVLYIDKFGPIARLSARGSIKEFERKFKVAQERGEIPANVELEKILAELASQS